MKGQRLDEFYDCINEIEEILEKNNNVLSNLKMKSEGIRSRQIGALLMYILEKQKPKLKYQLLSGNAFNPVRSTTLSSGIDVFSPTAYVVESNTDILIPLDLRFEIPVGYDLVVHNKSGVSTKKKLLKGAELIDCDYRGNCHIHLFNLSDKDMLIEVGENIAQLVLRKVCLSKLEKVDNISINTERGEGGFGSTGTMNG